MKPFCSGCWCLWCVSCLIRVFAATLLWRRWQNGSQHAHTSGPTSHRRLCRGHPVRPSHSRLCTAVLTRLWPPDMRSIPTNPSHQHQTAAMRLKWTRVYYLTGWVGNSWRLLDETATPGGEIAARCCSLCWAAGELAGVESTASKIPQPPLSSSSLVFLRVPAVLTVQKYLTLLVLILDGRMHGYIIYPSEVKEWWRCEAPLLLLVHTTYLEELSHTTVSQTQKCPLSVCNIRHHFHCRI